ncbi:hypothetical protein ACWGAN_26430 [Streptomyces sp. NPDC054945]
MTALHSNPLFDRLADAESILVTGAGGGFGVYAGLPLALSLMHRGKRVQLANLSFSMLAGLPAEAWVAPDPAAPVPLPTVKDRAVPRGCRPEHDRAPRPAR